MMTVDDAELVDSVGRDPRARYHRATSVEMGEWWPDQERRGELEQWEPDDVDATTQGEDEQPVAPYDEHASHRVALEHEFEQTGYHQINVDQRKCVKRNDTPWSGLDVSSENGHVELGCARRMSVVIQIDLTSTSC
ncbi:hypothetical protein PsorP6_001051 [Peronosclerospora sorghi]|uniref:Uncharacterized protein n=1 Tax=Peronosclerospora sorghi TaxID=230839 RepID=A0ACC0WRQ4_9STRA|nr:hypothetical protein PsorP6_001051 [Peronosclerospora sorghi]